MNNYKSTAPRDATFFSSLFELCHCFVIRHSSFAAYKRREARVGGLSLRGFVIF
jgi:hypothetical protein